MSTPSNDPNLIPVYFEVDLPDGYQQKKPRKMTHVRRVSPDDNMTPQEAARARVLAAINHKYNDHFKGRSKAQVRIYAKKNDSTPALVFTIQAIATITLVDTDTLPEVAKAETRSITVPMAPKIKQHIERFARDKTLTNPSATARHLIEGAMSHPDKHIPSLYPPFVHGAELRAWKNAAGLTNAQAAPLWGLQAQQSFIRRLNTEPQKRRQAVVQSAKMKITLKLSTIEQIKARMTQSHVNIHDAIRDILVQQLGIADEMANDSDFATATS